MPNLSNLAEVRHLTNLRFGKLGIIPKNALLEAI